MPLPTVSDPLVASPTLAYCRVPGSVSIRGTTGRQRRMIGLDEAVAPLREAERASLSAEPMLAHALANACFLYRLLCLGTTRLGGLATVRIRAKKFSSGRRYLVRTADAGTNG